MAAKPRVIADATLRVTQHDIAPVTPLDDTPFWDQPWIAPVLHDLAFGPIGDDTPNTFLIVDAVLRRNIIGVFDLDLVDVPIACLYDGNAAQDYAETAPYVVDLTLNGAAPTSFHRELFATQWQAGTGILLRSTANMPTLRRHLRRFTMTENAAGRRMFFRFWEPNMMRDYYEHLAHDLPQRARDIFVMRDGDGIQRMIGQSSGTTTVVDAAPDQLRDIAYANTPFRLSPGEEDALYLSVLRRYANDIAAQIEDPVADRTQSQRDALVFECVRRMRGHGISQIKHLKILATWDLSYGGAFENRVPQTQDTLSGPGSEDDRIARLQALVSMP